MNRLKSLAALGLKRLIEGGFDKSWLSSDEHSVHVRCSGCEALVVNGTATHEHGCPNEHCPDPDPFNGEGDGDDPKGDC
jgi:hypothetical protein